ncbi:Protein CBR-CRH-1 [Caenorhabditis briggsae]|uniref:Protein CBR-CRH-1 n=1 Tax=Caenorhabditis briggsae TaxID=6238 RepID=A8XHE3_CAEBR|nr:Protein CBR-CRH-1 [Caenorhabditis briggsae]CAP32067.2 Protein CBR-CRH-1 [Caenorhabditis briggsae]
MAMMTSTSTCSPVAGSPLMMLLFKAMQEGADSEDEARRRREQLNRRPSYRSSQLNREKKEFLLHFTLFFWSVFCNGLDRSYTTSDSETSSSTPSTPTGTVRLSAFRPLSMTTINPASYSHQPTYPLFGTSTPVANPSVTDVATALFRMTTPLGGDGNPLTSRDRCMILKDLETADKVMKKEPEETPPSSVDVSPLQSVMRPPPPQLPGPPPPAVPTAVTPNRIVTSSSAASPYGSPLGASLLSSQPLVLPFAPINGDFDFNAAIAAVSQPKPDDWGRRRKRIVSLSLFSPLYYFSEECPDQFGTTDWQSPMLSGGYSSSPSPTMTGSSGSMRMGGGPMHGGEDESNRKRQVRLLKNREAAKECRRKKKEYVKCLENRVSVLENQNKALIEELKTLKELYCRKEKDQM